MLNVPLFDSVCFLWFLTDSDHEPSFWFRLGLFIKISVYERTKPTVRINSTSIKFPLVFPEMLTSNGVPSNCSLRMLDFVLSLDADTLLYL